MSDGRNDERRGGDVASVAFLADEALLEMVTRAVRHEDGPPSECVDLGIDAFSLARELAELDAEFAELVRDSAPDEGELVGTRGRSRRVLEFRLGADVLLEVDVVDRELVGRVTGAELVSVEWRSAGNSGVIPIEGSTFELDPHPDEPIYLLVGLGERRIVTDWIVLY